MLSVKCLYVYIDILYILVLLRLLFQKYLRRKMDPVLKLQNVVAETTVVVKNMQDTINCNHYDN